MNPLSGKLLSFEENQAENRGDYEVSRNDHEPLGDCRVVGGEGSSLRTEAHRCDVGGVLRAEDIAYYLGTVRQNEPRLYLHEARDECLDEVEREEEEDCSDKDGVRGALEEGAEEEGGPQYSNEVKPREEHGFPELIRNTQTEVVSSVAEGHCREDDQDDRRGEEGSQPFSNIDGRPPDGMRK